MRTHSRNSPVVTAAVFTIVGVAAVAATMMGDASASSSSSGSTDWLNLAAATSSPTAATSAPTASGSPTATSSPTASATSSATSTPSDGSECAAVYTVAAPTGDSVGKLCTAVTGSETTVSEITVTYTATSTCSGNVMLRASGIDKDGAEFGKVKSVACSSGTATASFTPITETTSGTEICGLLISDVYTGAQACVSIS